MANNLVVQLLLKTGTFSHDLKTAKGQVQSFQKGCQSAGNAVSSFTSALGINLGSLSKFGGAAAAAAAAGKLLKDSFKENTDAMDAFNREAQVVKSTYRSLSSQLFKNGKISIDFSGIADQAREYYNAMDNAQVAAVAITNELKLQEVEYNRLWGIAMDVSLSEVDRLDALNEASKVMKQQLTLKKQLAQVDRMVAKEGLENGLVSRGINKYKLETEYQGMLKDLLQFDSQNAQYMFDTYYSSVNTNNARTSGHKGVYGRTMDMMSTSAGSRAVEQAARQKGFKDVQSYLKALKKEEDETTEIINSTKYQLAQALHNMRGSTEGYEQISKYVLLYLNDMGLNAVEAEQKNADAQIARLRKRITGRDGSTVNYEQGTIGWYEQELDRLNDDLKKAVSDEARQTILNQIEGIKATLKTLRGEEVNLTEGTEEWLRGEITKLEEEREKLNVGLPDTSPLIQKMNDWEGTWEQFVASLTEEEKKVYEQFATDMKRRWEIVNTIAGYNGALSSAQGTKTSSTPKPVYAEGSYGARRESLERQIAGVQQALMGGVGLTNEDIQAKIAELRGLEKQLQDLEIQFGFRTVLPKVTNDWETFNQAMANTATIVSSLTSTFQDGAELTAASVLQMVATALPAIGSLVSAISALTTAEAVEAGVAATGKAVATSKHWIEAIAAVASLGAVVATAIQSAKSQKFANGGIVGGSSFTGDRVTASVNSGEMILNRAQQANLFRMANSGGGAGAVEFHISGTDLVGVLNNNTKKNRVIR